MFNITPSVNLCYFAKNVGSSRGYPPLSWDVPGEELFTRIEYDCFAMNGIKVSHIQTNTTRIFTDNIVLADNPYYFTRNFGLPRGCPPKDWGVTGEELFIRMEYDYTERERKQMDQLLLRARIMTMNRITE